MEPQANLQIWGFTCVNATFSARPNQNILIRDRANGTGLEIGLSALELLQTISMFMSRFMAIGQSEIHVRFTVLQSMSNDLNR